MLEIGPKAIEQRVLSLAGRAREILRELGGSVEEYASPIVAARFENQDVSALARSLKEKRVLVAARRGHLRVSPHFYNNEKDLEILQDALKSELAVSRR
jgi:cysteine desulfurase/selenocysteine lyase